MNYSIVYLKSDSTIMIGGTFPATHENCVTAADTLLANLNSYPEDSGYRLITSYVIIPSDNLPKDRSHKESWRFDAANQKVYCDLKIEQQIQVAKLKFYRQFAFNALDANKMQFLNDAVKLAEIEVKAQALRDFPQHVDFTGCDTFQKVMEYIPTAFLDVEFKHPTLVVPITLDTIKQDRGYYT
jgi:hypothetical protein